MGVKGLCLHSCVALRGLACSAGGGREKGPDSPTPAPPLEAGGYRRVSDIIGTFSVY